MKEKYEKEKQTKEIKKELKEQKEMNRKKELEIIKLRAYHLEFHLKEGPRGKAFYGNWKNVPLGKYIGIGLPNNNI